MTLPPTETRNPNSADLDQLDTAGLLALISAEDHGVAPAVATQLPAITRATDAVVQAFRDGGRLIYAGAGTSGRLGVLDASECGPTFSAPPDMVIGLIAGGDRALRHPVEGAEDDRTQGAADVATLAPSQRDVVIGLAASGSTPYVLGALSAAQGPTVAITCAPGSPVARAADISIAPQVGPEVLTGSTRMKAGTAQKLVLNMISTAAMVRIGKSWGNLMVDLQVSNAKLAARAARILSDITGLPQNAATDALHAAGGDLKTAAVMHLAGVSQTQAQTALTQAQGHLRQAIAIATAR